MVRVSNVANNFTISLIYHLYCRPRRFAAYAFRAGAPQNGITLPSGATESRVQAEGTCALGARCTGLSFIIDHAYFDTRFLVTWFR